jgi:hypothetical protein
MEPARHFPRLELGEAPTPVRPLGGLGALLDLRRDEAPGSGPVLYWHSYGPRRNGG